MGSVAILGLRIVLAAFFAGSLFVQGVLALDLVGVPWQLATFVVLGIATVQVSGAPAPGDVAPGIVLMACGLSLVIAGMALLVLVLRTLLAQAVARDTQAQHLQAELSEVI